MTDDDYMAAKANVAERERLANEMVDLMPLPFERKLLVEDVRIWRVSGRKCVRGHEGERVSITLTAEDVDALRDIRRRKIDALVEEFELIGKAVER